jgi:hypothetical protein
MKIMTKEKGLEYFYKLQSFFKKLMSQSATEEDRQDILEETMALIQYTAQKIDERRAEKGVDTRQIFNLEFIEIVKQIAIVIKRLNLEVLKFNSLKLKVLMDEFGSLVECREHTSLIQKLRDLKKEEILRLLAESLTGVLKTFVVAIIINQILHYTGLLAQFKDWTSVLVTMEAGMAALIVFITSFNLSYTNAKRGRTDMELINFMTQLNIYARRIKFILQSQEPDKGIRMQLFENINYYFNCIGLKLVEGAVPQKGGHNLKFDTAILQCLDLINKLIERYTRKMEEDSKIRTSTIQDEVVAALNTFQITATVRVPKVFSAMNDWLIRITYFSLVAIAPDIYIIPRLFVVNLFQRAFFNVAREVDNAIYSTSIATLPVINRVVRRLCRISSILNEDDDLGAGAEAA